VFVDSMRPLERPWSRVAPISSRCAVIRRCRSTRARIRHRSGSTGRRSAAGPSSASIGHWTTPSAMPFGGAPDPNAHVPQPIRVTGLQRQRGDGTLQDPRPSDATSRIGMGIGEMEVGLHRPIESPEAEPRATRGPRWIVSMRGVGVLPSLLPPTVREVRTDVGIDVRIDDLVAKWRRPISGHGVSIEVADDQLALSTPTSPPHSPTPIVA
jgi:hypothetical protein